MDQAVDRGSAATFTCTYRVFNAEGVAIQWTGPSGVVSPPVTVNGENYTSTLTLNNVMETASGEYFCSVSYTGLATPINSTTATLTVNCESM